LKKYFTIGEISKIYNFSVHSIRHYHKKGVIEPSYIDEETGYRYYSFERFQYFSRLKYLRSLGLSLDQIKNIFDSGSSKELKNILDKLKLDKEKEINEISKTIKKIDWLNTYYSYFENDNLKNVVYKRSFEERYLFQSFCEEIIALEDMDVKLHKEINSKEYSNLNCHRHFGYLLNFESLMKGKFKPISTTILLNDKQNIKSDHLKVLPKGYYLCFSTYLLNNNFNIDPLIEYINKNNLKKTKTIIAFEYEDNLNEFYNAIYEIQILF